ncbi:MULTISPECIES: hypothetical protein [unclassified Planococcus (in: firmicutes)]|uniref:rolling circle replication-associated protein n=1 Tax=unclassified Planococcus (in: firmicutes) TaxID=2662419 RepID=UPI000C33C09A|nr:MULTISPECIES: hypothetical protein [unclassified Planococcus (in: firmicutes)]AUD12504.1 hypothetical protein CW734_01135 [Planococcus sp. MB-3u-03]PKG48695.1 hypothetical protein CXF66_00300 [Planococcus sp. Urea-trap-24]PKG90836.1 hypothetical protein CXF91_03580 [Planococcus sp. Urea-3u-39]PKH36704.1 hypothetical protein CXF77_14035 [Planococcus sp. MB-3u-09]
MTKNDEKTVDIQENHYVTVTDMGHLIEIQHMKKRNSAVHIKKLDAYTYLNLETGEICEYNKSENRSENENSLRQTFKNMRYLINHNFKGKSNELFVTLTFAKESFDEKMVSDDIEKFIKRLRYRYKAVSAIDYLNVVEPHQSGQFHAHVLFRFNDVRKIYIPVLELKELWSHGRVDIKTLKNVDNIGAYLSAYMADIELTEENLIQAMKNGEQVVVKDVEGQKKKFIKGGRLKYYPPGMRIFRKSAGIKYPERVEMTYKNAKKIVGSAQPHYKKSYEIQNEDFSNTITYEQYNLKRGSETPE